MNIALTITVIITNFIKILTVLLNVGQKWDKYRNKKPHHADLLH